MTDPARTIQSPDTETRTQRVGIVKTYVTDDAVITVTLDGAEVVMPCLVESVDRPYDTGASVLLTRDGRSGWYCLGALGVAVAPPDTTGGAPGGGTPPPVEPGKQARAATILPTFTGSYRGGGWRNDTDQVIQGDFGGYGINIGMAAYGAQLPALHADTTLPCSGTVTYRRGTGGTFAAQTPTLWLCTDTGPGGAPDRHESSAAAAVPVGGVVAWALPTGWVQALLDGSRGALAAYVAGSTPYIRTDGRSEYGAAWALTLNYYA